MRIKNNSDVNSKEKSKESRKKSIFRGRKPFIWCCCICVDKMAINKKTMKYQQHIIICDT